MEASGAKNSSNPEARISQDGKTKTSPPPSSMTTINCPERSQGVAYEVRDANAGVIGGDSRGRMTSAQMQAQFYLNEKKIFELFNFLIGHLLVDEPADPIEYLADLLDKCMLFRAGLRDPPLLFTSRHVESMFQSLDPGGLGTITVDQYKAGMTTLGIGCYDMNPKTCAAGRVDKQTFETEAISRPTYVSSLVKLSSSYNEVEFVDASGVLWAPTPKLTKLTKSALFGNTVAGIFNNLRDYFNKQGFGTWVPEGQAYSLRQFGTKCLVSMLTEMISKK